MWRGYAMFGSSAREIEMTNTVKFFYVVCSSNNAVVSAPFLTEEAARCEQFDYKFPTMVKAMAPVKYEYASDCPPPAETKYK